jgi:flagellar basal-body rod protein FlgB
MFDQMFGPSFKVIERALDVRMMRQNIVAANIANCETPGYVAVELDFEATMKRLAERIHQTDQAAKLTGSGNSFRALIGDPDKITTEDLVLRADDTAVVGNDGNTVSMEREVVKSQENKLMYSVVTQLIGLRLKGLKSAISGGQMGG